MKTIVATAAISLALTASAAAQQTSSADRDAFFASASDAELTLLTFDDLAAETVLSEGVLDGVTITALGGAIVVTDTFLTSTGGNGIGIEGDEFFRANDRITFTFDEAITAFAIDINTFADVDGSYLAITDGGDAVLSLFEVFDGRSTGQFIGFTSETAFTSITISALTASNIAFTLDTLFFGAATAVDAAAVPVPAAAWLFGTALFGGIAARRSR